MELNKIHNENCLETMSRMKDNFIDLTVTSPPYDNLRDYKGYSFDFENIAKELYRVTKEGGVVVWVIGDATIKGSETGTSFKQALYFKEVGFNLHDTMIWKKTNPMPQVKTKRYFACFEYMFIFSKGTPKTFNPIMVDCKLGGKIYDSTCKNMGGENGRTKKTFVLNKQRYKDNIWEIAIAQNKTGHPAVFPEKLASEHIKTWSNDADLVYDPFMGSGTTAKSSHIYKRNWIGSEMSKEYVDLANNRLSIYLNQKTLF